MDQRQLVMGIFCAFVYLILSLFSGTAKWAERLPLWYELLKASLSGATVSDHVSDILVVRMLSES